MLRMKWVCDACHVENIRDVTNETDFFAVILITKADHASLSPTCKWGVMKIHGRLFRGDEQIGGTEARVKAA